MNCLYLMASYGLISAASKVDSKAVGDDKRSCRRVCLICGNTETELSVYVLRPPEHLNGWIQHELSSIHSSLLVSSDQEGEKKNNVAALIQEVVKKTYTYDFFPFLIDVL